MMMDNLKQITLKNVHLLHNSDPIFDRFKCSNMTGMICTNYSGYQARLRSIFLPTAARFSRTISSVYMPALTAERS